MSRATATRPCAAAAAALLGFALTGCGSHSGPNATVEAAAPPIAADTAPSGPCDALHQDHAISVAQRVLHDRLRGCGFGRPSATFTSHFARPQVPGQPAQPPLFGWMVEFPLQAVDTSEADPHDALLQRACATDPGLLAASTASQVVRISAPHQRMQDPSDVANPAQSPEPATGFAPTATRPLDASRNPDDEVNLTRAPAPGGPVDPAHQEIPVPVDQVNTTLDQPTSSPTSVDVRRLSATITVFVAVDGHATVQ